MEFFCPILKIVHLFLYFYIANYTILYTYYFYIYIYLLSLFIFVTRKTNNKYIFINFTNQLAELVCFYDLEYFTNEYIFNFLSGNEEFLTTSSISIEGPINCITWF